MKIGIIGSGNIGGTLGKLWAQAGHSVFFSSRHPERLQTLCESLGSQAKAGSVREAVEFGETILFTPPYWETDHALALAGRAEAFAGKVVLDATNPYTPDLSGFSLPQGTTAVSELVKKIPQALLVKAFNSLRATTLMNDHHLPFDQRYVVTYCGNDEQAKKIASGLIEDTGFIAFDLGPLVNATLQEPRGPFFDHELTLERAEHLLRSLGTQEQEAA